MKSCALLATALLPLKVAAVFIIGLIGECAYAGENPPRPFGDIVGLNVKYAQGEPQADLPLLKELGVRWVRDCVSWPEVEPSAGNYVPFPKKFQDRLQFYKDNNIGVDFLLCYENTRAYPDTNKHPHDSLNAEAYGRYAVAAAKLLKASGVRFVLEIWNEPHNFTLKKKLGGDWTGKPPSPWVDHYIAMVNEAVKQVKAYDPQVRLLDDDDMWIIHYWYLERGLPKDLDGFAFHPYSGASVGPEMTAVGQETTWARPFTLVDADRSFASAVHRLRAQSLRKWGKLPSLWATEWGWGIGEKAPFTQLTPDASVTDDAVAAYIPRAFITAAAAGVETVCWFSSYDSVDGPMGLRSNDGKHRPAFGAFKTMAQELATYSIAKQVVGADHLTSGPQAFLFHGAKGNKLVLWNIDGEATFQVNGKGDEPIHVVDVQGRNVELHPAPGEPLQLDLTQSPIYVTGLPDAMTLQLVPPSVATPPVYLFP